MAIEAGCSYTPTAKGSRIWGLCRSPSLRSDQRLFFVVERALPLVARCPARAADRAPAGPRVSTAPGGGDGAAAEHEEDDLVLRSCNSLWVLLRTQAEVA